MMSPSGDSILITSAPRSPRICVASGPNTTVVRSRTLVPASGPGLASLTAPPQGCPRKIVRRRNEGNRRPNFVLAGLGPWAFSPRTSIRGHPRLGAVDAKTWMRGSSPRKTTLSRSHGVQNKCQLQENFPRTGLLLAGKVREGTSRNCRLGDVGITHMLRYSADLGANTGR